MLHYEVITRSLNTERCLKLIARRPVKLFRKAAHRHDFDLGRRAGINDALKFLVGGSHHIYRDGSNRNMEDLPCP